MGEFKKGDRVVVVAAGPENAGTVGKTGVVFYEASEANGEITVKGIDGRVKEAALGYRTYDPAQLRLA
jgi:ribosomal protein L24